MENETLNAKQTFENYVSHEGNNFAVHMAKEIAVFCTDDCIMTVCISTEMMEWENASAAGCREQLPKRTFGCL